MGGARAGKLTKGNSKYIRPCETSQDPRFATEVSTSIKLEFRTLQIGHAEEESINRRNAHFGAICRKNICEKTATATTTRNDEKTRKHGHEKRGNAVYYLCLITSITVSNSASWRDYKI